MYPTIANADVDHIVLKLHIPNIDLFFLSYEEGGKEQRSNSEVEGIIRRNCGIGHSNFIESFPAKKSAISKEIVAEFQRLARFLPATHIDFLVQVFFIQKTFHPERDERAHEIKKGLEFFENLKNEECLVKYMTMALFAVPTDLLKDEVIFLRMKMLHQIQTYFVQSDFVKKPEYDTKEVKCTLQDLWGKEVCKLMFSLGLAKISKKNQLKPIHQALSDYERCFAIIYEFSSLPHLDSLIEAWESDSEMVINLFKAVHEGRKSEDGKYKKFAEVDIYILLVTALQMMNKNHGSDILSYLKPGEFQVCQQKALFPLFLYLGARKILDGPKIDSPTATTLTNILKMVSKFETVSPEEELAGLKAELEKGDLTRLNALIADNLGSEEGVDKKVDAETRKLLTHVNEQIVALTEEELDAIQHDLDTQRPPVVALKSSKRNKKKKGRRRGNKAKPPRSVPPPPATEILVAAKHIDHNVEQYIAAAFFSHSMAVLNREKDIISAIDDETLADEKRAELLTSIKRLSSAVKEVQGKNTWKKSELKSLNGRIMNLEKECDTVLDTIDQQSRPSAPDERHKREFREFCQSVERHVASKTLTQSYNRGDSLQITPSERMRFDIKSYFHGRQVEEFRSLEFTNPSRKLGPNEKLAYYVTRSSSTADMQYCISVHLWRLKRSVTASDLQSSGSRVDSSNWIDMDKGLGTSYYVLHIPKPRS